MPCLVSKQHEHHILLGVFMDLSQPCLVTTQDKGTKEREHVQRLEKQKDIMEHKNLKTCNKHKKGLQEKKTLSGTWQGRARALNLTTWIKRGRKVWATTAFRWIWEKEENTCRQWHWGKERECYCNEQFNQHCWLLPVLTTTFTQGKYKAVSGEQKVLLTVWAPTAREPALYCKPTVHQG